MPRALIGNALGHAHSVTLGNEVWSHGQALFEQWFGTGVYLHPQARRTKPGQGDSHCCR